MSDSDPGEYGDNTKYIITRVPNLEYVTPGAKVHYECVWKGIGTQPRVAGRDQFGQPYNRLSDGVTWCAIEAGRPEGKARVKVKADPRTPDTSWDLTWDEPGQWTVIAEIRNGVPGNQPTYRFRSQQIAEAGAMLNDWLDRLLKHGDGPSPEQAEKEIGVFRKKLDEVASRFPPKDPAAHKKIVDKWTDLAGRLRQLLAPTDGKRRIPVRALHLETETQNQRPLLLFFTELPDVTEFLGKAGFVKKKKWVLVDWTDASDPRFRGPYEGEGEDTKEAIESCLSSWSWGNRYPAGRLEWQVPPELRPILGGDVRRTMEPDGKNLKDKVIIVFEWIAIGTMLIAGFCFIFVGVSTLTSLAMGTSMMASTAGAVMSIRQRWRDGLFDWQADAIDGLTILGNLIGAGVWARGARVKILGKGAEKLDCVFLGTRLANDTVQGILIAESRMRDLDALMNDPSIPPEERARKVLQLLAELTAVGLMTAVSIKASASEADALSKKPKYLKPDDPRANVPDDTIKKLTEPPKPGDPPIDLTRRPAVEGDTKETPQHKTKMQTGVTQAPVSAPLKPTETDFAKLYKKDGHQWQIYKLNEYEIHLKDADNFEFHATCDEGSLNVRITTVFDPKENPQLAATLNKPHSDVMNAKDLYPKMYKHFEQVGNPVTRLEGVWVWSNYKDAKLKYDEEIGKGKSPRDAAMVAVKFACSYIRYHEPQGFTKVLDAEYVPGFFTFTIVKGP